LRHPHASVLACTCPGMHLEVELLQHTTKIMNLCAQATSADEIWTSCIQWNKERYRVTCSYYLLWVRGKKVMTIYYNMSQYNPAYYLPMTLNNTIFNLLKHVILFHSIWQQDNGVWLYLLDSWLTGKLPYSLNKMICSLGCRMHWASTPCQIWRMNVWVFSMHSFIYFLSIPLITTTGDLHWGA
jgi:hypothetical protein